MKYLVHRGTYKELMESTFYIKENIILVEPSLENCTLKEVTAALGLGANAFLEGSPVLVTHGKRNPLHNVMATPVTGEVREAVELLKRAIHLRYGAYKERLPVWEYLDIGVIN